MKKIILSAVLLMTGFLLMAQTDQLPKLKLEVFSTGYTKPIGIECAGDSRLFIVEKAGKIWICDSNGTKNPIAYLNIADKVLSNGGEQGLLGMAFHPNYATNGYLYVNYINLSGNTVISRFKRNHIDTNRVYKSTEVVLMTITQPTANHKGGCLRFGNDGYLYISTGDGGGVGDPNNVAQNISSNLGKMLRISVSQGSGGLNYSVPGGNPFIGVAGANPEIWATGLRNPWRFSCDRLTGDMWIADVGQSDWEEINFQPAGMGGVNYGWGCWESAHHYKANCNTGTNPAAFPIAEYVHGAVAGVCGGSVTGGYVYRGSQFPDMYGKYFYADYCTGIFRTVYKDHGVWVNRYLHKGSSYQYASFGEDKDGEFYLTNYASGQIYRVVDTGSVVPRFAPVSNLTRNQSDDMVLFPNPNTGNFTVQLNASQKEICTVTILNQLGTPVLSETKSLIEGFNEWEFSSEKFAKGIYVFRLKTRGATISKRFTVQ